MRMTFKENKTESFQGGLEFFNPARWDYDPMKKELELEFPEAADEHLQIFKMSVGDGVKRFDRAGKRVVYAFDADTTSLNVAGWVYSKGSAAPRVSVPSLVEPFHAGYLPWTSQLRRIRPCNLPKSFLEPCSDRGCIQLRRLRHSEHYTRTPAAGSQANVET